MTNQRDILRLHRCIALVFAPLLALQAITGGMLLFREPLARLIDPGAMVRTSDSGQAAVSTLVTGSALAVEPGFRVSRIFLPASPRDAAFVHLDSIDGLQKRYASLDPGNGRVLAVGTIWRFPFEAALQLHYRLIGGRLGMTIVLFNAIALFFMSVTGLLYWWPGRKRIAKALVIRPTAQPRVRLRQWHRSIGVILTPLICFSAATGAMLIVPDLAASPAVSGSMPPPPGPAQIDRAFARAMARAPDATIRDIRFPLADRIDVNFYAPRYNSQAIDVVSVRLSDGKLLKRLPAESNPALWIKILPLHSGTAMGLSGRLFLGMEGLALVILAVTGPIMWWHARRPKPSKS